MNERKIMVAPSILSADFARLGEGVTEIAAGGAGLVHVDVMDGHFVPNISIGPAVTASLRKVTQLPLHCHLKIAEPDRYHEAFVDAGAEMLSVHVEAAVHLHRTVTRIQQLGAKAGVVLNPSTPLSALTEILPLADYVLLMSVNPGFGGQAFIPEAIPKIHRLRSMTAGQEIDITVDGGVGPGNAAALVAAGATTLVAGSEIFGRRDREKAIAELRNCALGDIPT